MICQNCGTENRPDVRFCRSCGQPLTLAVTPTPTPMPPITSPSVAPPGLPPAPIPPLASPAAALPGPPPVENPLKSSSTAVLPPNWRVPQADVPPPSCPHCGMTVKPGARFCAHCGKPLLSAPVDSAPPLAQPMPYPVAPREAATPLLLPPVYPSPSPQATLPQPLVGEYPSSAAPTIAATPLPSPQLPQARRRQLPGWLVWLLIGLAVIAMIGMIALLVTSVSKGLKGARATATPLPATAVSPTATPQPTATVASVSSESALPVQLALTTAADPWLAGQSGVLTLTLQNHSAGDLRPQRLEILGTWEPMLVFTPTAQKDIEATITVLPNDVWVETFAFDALEAGEVWVSVSVKFERSDTRQIDVFTSDKIQLQVVNPVP